MLGHPRVLQQVFERGFTISIPIVQTVQDLVRVLCQETLQIRRTCAIRA
jgi:hypothetical protein